MFSAEGTLLYATGELDADTTLATLGAENLKADAIAAGQATGETAIGALTLTRLGSGTTTVLVATLPDSIETVEPLARPQEALGEGPLDEIVQRGNVVDGNRRVEVADGRSSRRDKRLGSAFDVLSVATRNESVNWA